MERADEDTSASLTESLLEGKFKDNDDENKEITLAVEPAAEVEQEPLDANAYASSWEVGEKQESAFRDTVWAALFLAHLLVVIVTAIVWGRPTFDWAPNGGASEDTFQASGVLYLCLLAGLASVVVSGLTLGIMIQHPKVLVQISVVFSVVVSLAVVVTMASNGEAKGAIIAAIFFFLACFYAWQVWSRIPFAAANLSTAVTAVRANLGVAFAAYGMVLVVFAWTCIWGLSLSGVYSRSLTCTDGVCQGHVSGWSVACYIFSYYWTQQVIKNVIHVTIAGVVGTWWIVPSEASSFCSPAILDSFARSTTYSFGSICCGSLVVAVIRVLHALVRNGRREGEDNILLCILDCIISILERIMLYFNKWAYVYVGLYGYSYSEAGRRVMTLFSARGWTTVINDDLVSNTLGLVTLVIGCLTGVVGMVIWKVESSWLAPLQEEASGFSFASAFLIGIMISSTLMSVIASAVDTVVVCFAETPSEFCSNHPELSENMIRAWTEAYPGEYCV